MAKKYSKSSSQRTTRKKASPNKSSELKSFAYKMGQVSRGLKGDTQVAASYNAGANNVGKSKKPLY